MNLKSLFENMLYLDCCDEMSLEEVVAVQSLQQFHHLDIIKLHVAIHKHASFSFFQEM